jgi:hypothetical protein
MARRTTFAADVDNEMASLLAIAHERANPTMQYPAHVWAALETAYCTHFRAFMEFVHNGRPASSGPKTDTKLNDFTNTPVQVQWNRPEEARFRAADKLGAHVSRGRAQRRHTKRPWGGAQDHALVLPRIRDVFHLVPGATTKFKRTAELLPPGT